MRAYLPPSPQLLDLREHLNNSISFDPLSTVWTRAHSYFTDEETGSWVRACEGQSMGYAGQTGPPVQDAHGSFSVAGALKLVQIPAGARHIQIEELEKIPHHIGECRGAGGGVARPWGLPSAMGKLGGQTGGF